MRRKNRGYSLIELLVVLVIMGLVAGVVLPNMARLYESYKLSTDWSDIRDQVNSLGLLAYQEDKPYQLTSGEPLIGIAVFPLQLPDGWKYQTSVSIQYKSSGACLGGELLFFYNDDLYRVQQLKVPNCQVSL